MAQKQTWINFQFAQGSTDEARALTYHELQKRANVAAAGTENASYYVQPGAMCSTLVREGEDAESVALEIREMAGVDPASVVINRDVE